MIITLGGDPEAFYVNNEMVVPAGVVFAMNNIIGDRVNTEYGDLYVDGADIEFQPKPATNPEEVLSNITNLMELASTIGEEADTTVEVVPEMEIDLSWCNGNPELAVFGCDPDKSIWGEECVPEAIDASKHPWRYAGCHLHFGVADNPKFFESRVEQAISSFDRTIGLLSLATSGGLGEQRRKVYGRPGIYRHQPWGIEYRTPANTLLANGTLVEAYQLGIKVIEKLDEVYDMLKDLIPDKVLLDVLRYGTPADADTLLKVAVKCL